MFKFDINTVVEPAVKSAKTFTSMITVDSLRKSMDAVIDANVELVKYCYSMNQWYIDTVAKAPK